MSSIISWLMFFYIIKIFKDYFVYIKYIKTNYCQYILNFLIFKMCFSKFYKML
jgi:hypothetical protein